MVDFSPAVYNKYRLRGGVRIHNTYGLFHTNYMIRYTVRTDFPVQITRYDTQYVRISPYKLHDTYGNTYVFSIFVHKRF